MQVQNNYKHSIFHKIYNEHKDKQNRFWRYHWLYTFEQQRYEGSSTELSKLFKFTNIKLIILARKIICDKIDATSGLIMSLCSCCFVFFLIKWHSTMISSIYCRKLDIKKLCMHDYIGLASGSTHEFLRSGIWSVHQASSAKSLFLETTRQIYPTQEWDDHGNVEFHIVWMSFKNYFLLYNGYTKLRIFIMTYAKQNYGTKLRIIIMTYANSQSSLSMNSKKKYLKKKKKLWNWILICNAVIFAFRADVD